MIKRFRDYFESISGTELVGPMGPNYGNTQLPHKPNSKNTDAIYSEVFGKVVTQDEYQELYIKYLKSNSNHPLNGFNLENLETVLSKINESINNEDVLEYFLDLSDLGARVEFDEDFDGNGTPCLEIELIGGWDPYKNDDVYQFILDIHKISVDLSDYNQVLTFKGTSRMWTANGRKRINSTPLSKKIKIEASDYTQNQFKRIEDLYNLVVSDITYMYSDHNYPIFRIKFTKSEYIKESNNVDTIKEIVTELFQDLSDDGVEISYKRNQWGELLDQDSIEFSWRGDWRRLELESYSFISIMVNISKICKDISFDKNDNILNLMKTNKYILLKRYFDRMEQELDTKIKNIDYYQDQVSGFIVIFISKINI